jgi:hypothetical protein
MKCSIVVRKTLDWDQIKTMDDFEEHCGFRQVLPYVEIWNRVLNMPYWEYRSALKRIAQKSLRNTGLDIISPDNIPEEKDHIIIPIDDDDWLSPEIKDIVPPLFEGSEVKMVHWSNAYYCITGHKVSMGCMSSVGTTLSCSYAVRSIVPKEKWLFHTKVQKYRSNIELRNKHLIRYYKKKNISMYIRHLGNVTSIRKLDLYINSLPLKLSSKKMSRSDEWCDPYSREIIKLMSSIRVKPMKMM